MLEGLKSPMTIGRLKGCSEKGKVWQGWAEYGGDVEVVKGETRGFQGD